MVRGRLHNAAVRTEVVLLEGSCTVTGCILPATRTSRLVPVGASWVGGRESYAPHCELHHRQRDRFNNGDLWVVDTDAARLEKLAIMSLLQLSEQEFC
jgi:hypothetical protein